MSVKVKEILEALTSKFEYLVSLHEQTRMHCNQLEQDVEFVRNQLGESEAKVEELEDKNKNLLVTKAFSSASGQDSEEAQEKISKIVREIDKCIALLSN